MKRITVLLALLATGWSAAYAVPVSTNSAVTSRILMIDSSSMPVGAGKATLTIGPLQRTNGIYSGDYKLKVFPWFFKNEKGTLAITVSDESLAEASQGKVVTITGTATTVSSPSPTAVRGWAMMACATRSARWARNSISSMASNARVMD